MQVIEWKSQFITSSCVDRWPEERTQSPSGMCQRHSGIGFLMRWSSGMYCTLLVATVFLPPPDRGFLRARAMSCSSLSPQRPAEFLALSGNAVCMNEWVSEWWMNHKNATARRVRPRGCQDPNQRSQSSEEALSDVGTGYQEAKTLQGLFLLLPWA